MYREIDDYESNKVLLETDDDYIFKSNKNITNFNKGTLGKGKKNTTKNNTNTNNNTNPNTNNNNNTNTNTNTNTSAFSKGTFSKDSISNNFIDSKTFLFTDDTNISSDIDDDEIFTMHI